MRRRRDRSSSGDDDDLLPDWGDAGMREHKKSGRHRRLAQDMYRMALLLTLVQSLLVPYNAVYNSHRPSSTAHSIFKDDFITNVPLPARWLAERTLIVRPTLVYDRPVTPSASAVHVDTTSAAERLSLEEADLIDVLWRADIDAEKGVSGNGYGNAAFAPVGGDTASHETSSHHMRNVLDNQYERDLSVITEKHQLRSLDDFANGATDDGNEYLRKSFDELLAAQKELNDYMPAHWQAATNARKERADSGYDEWDERVSRTEMEEHWSGKSMALLHQHDDEHMDEMFVDENDTEDALAKISVVDRDTDNVLREFFYNQDQSNQSQQQQCAPTNVTCNNINNQLPVEWVDEFLTRVERDNNRPVTPMNMAPLLNVDHLEADIVIEQHRRTLAWINGDLDRLESVQQEDIVDGLTDLLASEESEQRQLVRNDVLMSESRHMSPRHANDAVMVRLAPTNSARVVRTSSYEYDSFMRNEFNAPMDMKMAEWPRAQDDMASTSSSWQQQRAGGERGATAYDTNSYSETGGELAEYAARLRMNSNSMASTSSDVGASSGGNLGRARRLNTLPENDDEELIVVDDDDGDTSSQFTAGSSLSPPQRRDARTGQSTRVHRPSTTASQNMQRRGRHSHDEQLARQHRLHHTVADIVHADAARLREIFDDARYTPAQVDIIRRIRRRGKNKIAARNCRDRVTSTLTQLETEALVLEHELQSQLRRHDQLVAAVRAETEAIERLMKQKRERR